MTNPMNPHQIAQAQDTMRTALGDYLDNLAPTALAQLHTALTEIAENEPQGEYVLTRMAMAVQWAGEINCGDDFLEMIGK